MFEVIKSAIKRKTKYAKSGIKLEFGCGDKEPRDGFLGVDVRKFEHVHYCCNSWEIEDHIAPSSVSEVYSRHFFEHLTFPQAELTLNVWHKVMMPGANLQIIVPDIEYHIKQFLNPDAEERAEANSKWSVLQHAIAGFWGWQREGDSELWDVHKSGYDFRLIKIKLEECGFTAVKRLEDKPWNLNVSCIKPC